MAARISPLELASTWFRACEETSAFIDRSVRPVVERAADRRNPVDATYLGYLLRVTGWLRSLGKLNEPGDLQGASAGARALFEIAIDLTLLRHDSDSPIQKLVDWEESAKLKYARDRLSIHAGPVLAGEPADHLLPITCQHVFSPAVRATASEPGRYLGHARKGQCWRRLTSASG
jgi:hypothetical protein